MCSQSRETVLGVCGESRVGGGLWLRDGGLAEAEVVHAVGVDGEPAPGVIERAGGRGELPHEAEGVVAQLEPERC